MKTRNSFTALAFMVVVTLCTATVQAAIPAVERDALTALYDSTGGANWTDNTGWLGEPGTECHWHGVTCGSGETTVTGIHLARNHLEGSIPPEIGNLTNLETLNVQNNRLEGSIPKEIGYLSNLQRLVIRWTDVGGQIPNTIGNLANLEILDLYHNRFSGPVPPGIGNLEELDTLFLSSNQLVGELPTTLTNIDPVVFKIGYNGLYTTDFELQAFLERELYPAWAETQTLAPSNVSVTAVRDHSVELTWDQRSLPDHSGYGISGGYFVFVRPAGVDSWLAARWTSTTETTTFPITDLEPGTSYEFAVASFTNPHEFNENRVISETREPVMATTADLGCEAPTIVVDREDEIILSVDDTYDSYLWSTEETSPTLVVDPESPEWYWVTVTWDAGCEATASVLVRPEQLYVEQVEAE